MEQLSAARAQTTRRWRRGTRRCGHVKGVLFAGTANTRDGHSTLLKGSKSAIVRRISHHVMRTPRIENDGVRTVGGCCKRKGGRPGQYIIPHVASWGMYSRGRPLTRCQFGSAALVLRHQPRTHTFSSIWDRFAMAICGASRNRVAHSGILELPQTGRRQSWFKGGQKKEQGPTLLLKRLYPALVSVSLMRRDGTRRAPIWPVPPRTWTDAWDFFQRCGEANVDYPEACCHGGHSALQ